jgi:integrase/recombinase XerD
MVDAELAGVHATPKELRHTLGVAAMQNGIPLNLMQQCLAYTLLATTAIYADTVGPKEHAIAARMWTTGGY